MQNGIAESLAKLEDEGTDLNQLKPILEEPSELALMEELEQRFPEIESAVGKGTTTVLRVPLKAKAKRAYSAKLLSK